MSDIWKVLGIEPTSNEQEIKEAYRTKLTATHPEDHPEEFKILRVAYEEAIKSVHNQSMTSVFVKSPIDIWISKVEQVYCILSKRIDLSLWEMLLQEEICLAFDTSDLARNRLLEFLSEHYYLPRPIWQLIDRTFLLQENEEALCDILPPNFIRYVIHQINNDSHIEWKAFKSEDEADYDTYIINYFKLIEALNNKDEEGYKLLLSQLVSLGIEYIYLDVQKLRYALWKEDKERVIHLAEKIIDSEIKDEYSLYFLGEVDWLNARYEEAYEKWQKILVKDPNHYYAKLGIVKYEVLKKSYKKAKDKIYKLIHEFGSSDELEKVIEDINEKYVPQLQQQLKENTEDQELLIELGWCYLQQEKLAECATLLGSFTPTDQYIGDYYNLSGKSALANKDYRGALPRLKKWLEAIIDLEDDGMTEEIADKKRRIPYANYNIAMCYCNLEEDDNKNKLNYEKGLEYLEKAIDTIKQQGRVRDYLSYRERKAYILLKLGRMEESVSVCDEIIKEDPHFYPAYLVRQEAFMALKDGRGVIEDYYSAINLFSGYIKPYLLAIKVFIIHEQYEEAKAVIEKAKNNGLTSDQMSFYELTIRRQFYQSEFILNDILGRLIKLLSRQNELDSETDIQNFAEVYMEIAFCYVDINNHNKVIEYMNRAIELEPNNLNYRWTKADYFYRHGNYDEALQLYRSIESVEPDNINIQYDLAQCYSKQGNKEEALKYYLKVIGQDPKFKDANDCLHEFYSSKFIYTGDWNYYKLALKHINVQIEVTPESYYYINKGILVTEANNYMEALEAYKKAIELEPENKDAYNNIGYIYDLIERHDKAEAYYKLAIEKAKGEVYLRPYMNLASCYAIQERYNDAEQCYKQAIALAPHEVYIYDQLIQLYMRQGSYNKAIDVVLLMKKKNMGDRITLHSYLANCNWALSKKLKAYIIYYDMFRYTTKAGKGYIKKAEHYFFYQGRMKKALALYECAINRKQDLNIKETFECYYQLARCHGALKHNREAKDYFDICIAKIEKQYGTLENYIQYAASSKKYCGRLVSLYLSINDLENAKIYLKKMKAALRCNGCKYKNCYEATLNEAQLYEVCGDLEVALQCYETALIENNQLFIARKKVAYIKEQLKGAKN